MSKPIVSIIVPCYNCESYIERNIKSIIGQTHNDFEVIYINDGSTDGTLEILKNYQKKDKRLKVFSISNQGVSNARNIGIENAIGKYVAFIDADDYVDSNYIKRLYEETDNEKIDYVKCQFVRPENKTSVVTLKTFLCDGHENFGKIYEMLLNSYKLNQVYASLIRKSVITDNNIVFDKKYSYAEDLNFNISLFRSLDSFKYIDYIGYYYCDNPESITRKIHAEKIISNINAVKEIYGKFYNFDVESRKVDFKIEKELNHVLDSLFYFNTKISLKERKRIYISLYDLLVKNPNICNTFDMKLLSKRLYLLYDMKNYILKKIPRKIKRFLLK